MKESAKHQGPAQQQATLINESLNLGLLAQLKEEILHSEGSEVLALLPRAVGAPSLEVHSAMDGTMGSLSWGESSNLQQGLELIYP